MEPGSQLDVFRLSKDPSKWSSKHLIGLRIEERNDIHGTRIVDDSFEDENQGYESLVSEFCKPTRDEIAQSSRIPKASRMFVEGFSHIEDALQNFEDGYHIQQDLDKIATWFVCVIKAPNIHPRNTCWPIKFHLSSLNIRGRITGVGAYYQQKDYDLPYVISVGKKGSGLCSTEEIAPYLLLQALSKYERQPTLASHSTFVISMKGTVIQLSEAIVSQQYLNDIISQKVPCDILTLLRSKPYDLLEQDDRRECMRIFIDLVQRVKAQIKTYQLAEMEPRDNSPPKMY